MAPSCCQVRNSTPALCLFFGLLPPFFFFRSGVTNTPCGGVANCAQVKFLGMPFRSQRTLFGLLPLSLPSPAIRPASSLLRPTAMISYRCRYSS